MTALAHVARVADAHGLRLGRAWPRSGEHLLLELVPPHGPAVAGQWFADPARAAHVAAATGRPAHLVGLPPAASPSARTAPTAAGTEPPGSAGTPGSTGTPGGVVVQPAGADRRLRVLADLLRDPGAALVAHRPERRAVVRLGDGSYAKVVRPDRAAEVARTARAAAVPGVRVPPVLHVDAHAGVVVTGPLPGRTLHALLGDPTADVVTAAREVGRTLAALHATPPAADAPVHDATAELAVLRRWQALAAAHGVPVDVPQPSWPGSAGPLVTVHRDLHDKQLLVDGSGGIGLLDFDLAAAGEAALDLANLLVHLELRVHQGVCSAARAAAARDAVLAGYRPEPHVLARVPAYAAATRARLVAVYGFRPGSAAAARRLVSDEQGTMSTEAAAPSRHRGVGGSGAWSPTGRGTGARA